MEMMMCRVIQTYLVGQGFDLVVRSPNISSYCQDELEKASWEEKKHPNKPHTQPHITITINFVWGG
eukprot:5279172-Amphidinium_carterae.1